MMPIILVSFLKKLTPTFLTHLTEANILKHSILIHCTYLTFPVSLSFKLTFKQVGVTN